jgi:Arc/MetJ-type ribon-helix-helix transcriptional regulator
LNLQENENGTYVGSKIPPILKESIARAIKSGNYLNTSDFIRDAIKEKLQREGFAQMVSAGGSVVT